MFKCNSNDNTHSQSENKYEYGLHTSNIGPMGRSPPNDFINTLINRISKHSSDNHRKGIHKIEESFVKR